MKTLIAILLIVLCTGCAGTKMDTFTLRAHASHNIYTGTSHVDVEVYTNTR